MMASPTLRSRPARDVGIPVALEKSRFILVIPMARFHEKLNPGSFFFFTLGPLGWWERFRKGFPHASCS